VDENEGREFPGIPGKFPVEMPKLCTIVLNSNPETRRKNPVSQKIEIA